MKKNRKTILFIFISIFLVLIVAVSLIDNSFCQNTWAPQIKKAETPIQVKIPDGLYLYKPYFGEDKSGIFSPLVLVKNKKLIDPYVLAKKIGFEALSRECVTGKTFNVYVGSELFGKLRNLNLYYVSTPMRCQGGDFLLDIQCKGHYEGKPLPYGWFKEEKGSGYWYKYYGSTKIVVTPEGFKMTEKPLLFPVTDADMERMVEAVRKNFVPSTVEHLNKLYKNENRRVIGESGSRLYVAEAFDLDGNGEKDLVGIYGFSAKHTAGGFWGNDIVFVLWDTGKIEKIASDYYRSPAFILGGVIDIDQDGIQELIMASRCTPGPDSGDRRQIDILHHGPSGWKSIFRSKWICDIGLFYD